MRRNETITVLLLEDDPEDYHLLRNSVRNQKRQFVIDWVQTLAEAIEKLDRRAFDVVLTDLSVPDSQGMETVTRIRSHSGSAPIIVLTGTDDENMENDILSVGAQDYLVKGELVGRAVTRSILHAVQRQLDLNEVNDLVRELVESQQLLEQQKRLLHKKNRRLRRLYKTAQEFVDNVSHDFRTPLTVIKDYISIIREGMVGSVNEEQQAMLDKVNVRADDLNLMVDDLLDVSKLESGLLGAWRRTTNVEEIIDRVLPLLQQRAEVRNTHFEVEIDEDLPQVYCDSDKVGRVITNLAVNAIKFAGDRGQVKLFAHADPAEHQVVVGLSDDGPGIDQESLKQIFQRFQQLNSHVKSTVKGFGLGLNIAQQLCKLNLGELSVQSQLGKGSTFSFAIPMAYPTEVLRRWLKLQDKRDGLLKIIDITVDSRGESSAVDDFDNFLNCLLRRNSLLLRPTPHRWLLTMSVTPSEANVWFSRAKKEFERANRNRPLGLLPQYQAKLASEWDSEASHDEIVEYFEAMIQEEVNVEILK